MRIVCRGTDNIGKMRKEDVEWLSKKKKVLIHFLNSIYVIYFSITTLILNSPMVLIEPETAIIDGRLSKYQSNSGSIPLPKT